jgi:4-hydroxyphenylpyruvate dioxygenase
MSLAIHQSTSRAAGYRRSLEGWAKAGITQVEVTAAVLDDFLKSDSLDAARRVISDLGLTLVSCATVEPDLYVSGPARPAAVENWERRCEQFAVLGADKAYCPAVVTGPITADDYRAAPEHLREFGDIAREHGLTAMVEFLRDSPFLATLTTLLRLTREAAHSNVRPMFDCYHFWTGMGKFEELDLLETGEIAHVHFQDALDIPPELLTYTTRVIPGDGVIPLVRILRKLAEKGYSGPLSVELFASEFQNGDPFTVAREIREKSERVLHEAAVL